MRKPVYCIDCGKERNPKCRPGRCHTCKLESRLLKRDKEHLEYLSSHGYEILTIGRPSLSPHGKPIYHLIRKECGHEYTAIFQNIRKQIDELGVTPCAICGAEKRMAACMEGFLNKHGKIYDEQKYDDYRYAVRKASEKVYRKHKTHLNPNNLKRGRTSYHLDHKVPIIECFMRGISIERASCVENLEILPYVDNLSKHSRTFSEELALKLQKSPE